jgi:hypothetical protein
MKEVVNIHVFHECSGAHSHEYPQILVPLQKTMRIEVGESEYEVTPQELCLVPAEMTHRCNYQGELLVINLTESMLDNRDAAMLSYPTVISMRGQIVHLVELIQMELKNGLLTEIIVM